MGVRKEVSLFIPQLSIFLVFFGFTMNITALQLMILHKTCITSGHDEGTCKHLHQYPDVEDEVQSKIAPLVQKVMMLAFMPAALMTLILGPLSDVYGRKKILMVPVITTTISTLGCLLQSQRLELSPMLVYCANLMIGLGGGLGTFVSTIISYVTDSTLPEHRTERLSMLMPFLALGQTLGTFFSGILWEQFGATSMLTLSLIGFIVTLISLLYLEESQPAVAANDSAFSIGALLSNATTGWRVVSASRQNGRRRKILMLLIVGPAAIFFNTADITVVGLLTRRPPYQWSPASLSYFNTAKLVAQVIGTAALVPLYNKIAGSSSIQGDLNVMFICYCSAAMLCLVMIVATSSAHLLLGALGGFTSFLNNMTAALGSTAIYSLYTHTVHTLPNAAYTAILMVINGCLIIVLMLKRDFQQYPETEETKGD